ncbi:hypothetical protein AAC387_Pa11g0827 [Persea americana]|eukprot:TRINITY_DN6026_c0_g2_i1.p1 TRINITY_DN6026_c0_g2~~TRINITY_DN6026_c0_g2_i1.p1  ORF type:complete len:679 (-),score=119.68 TRINITY_DN6026_c0_g2_i1:1339-3375(-)
MSLQPRPPPSSACPRHHVTGLCAACLRERLSLLEPSSLHNNTNGSNNRSLLPPKARRDESGGSTQLRRSNSFSVQQEGVSVISEPHRRSCDVRIRSLCYLVQQGEGDGCGTTVSGGVSAVGSGLKPGSSAFQEGEGEKRGSSFSGGVAGEGEKRGSTVSGGVAAEGSTVSGGAVAAEVRGVNLGNQICCSNQQGEGDGRESTVSGGSAVDGGGLSSGVLEASREEEEEEEIQDEEEEEVRVGIEGGVATRSDFEEVGVRKMKDHINSDGKKNPAPDKGSSAIAGGFRHAASAFGKKLQKWRGKKKVSGGAGGGPMEGIGGRDEKPGNWQRARDAQSEMADYGYGRRSCDTDLPRFSLDAGRMSIDAPRRSFDNPRASWDGYLVGGRTMYRMPAMMGAVVEDCPVMIGRSDNKIPVEDSMNLVNEDPDVPGGSIQTRDYYLDSSSSQRRRRSFERSRSVRRAGGVVIDETNSGSISKVSPAMTDYLHRNRIADSKVPIPNFSSNSLRDDRSESFESVYRDISASRSNSKKGGWWSKSLSILGLTQRRGSSSKDDDNGNDDKGSHRGNVVERSMSETWRSEAANGELRGLFGRKSFHGNSTSGSRNSFSYNAFGSGRNRVETKMNGLKRNQSARYTSSTVESKLLQLNSAQHRKGSLSGGLGKSGSMNSESSAKSGLRMF